MMSFLNPILAQAAAAPDKVTVGTVITAALFLMTAVGSMAMIVAWVIRFGQTGHALPAARRGVLRVPWPLTLVAIILSVLFTVFALLSSFARPIPVANKVATQAPAATETSNADGRTDRPASSGTTTSGVAAPQTAEGEAAMPEKESSEVPDEQAETTVLNAQAAPDADGKETTKPAKTPSATPGQVQENLMLTIGMELMMLLAFGAVVLAASAAGRVYLMEPMVQDRHEPGRSASIIGQPGRAIGAGMGFGSPWPDLDDASSIPQMPGYDILENRRVIDPGRTPYGTTADALASPNLPVSPASRQLPEVAAHNPFAVVLEDEPFGTDTNAADAFAAEPRIADEPFSISRELRFAIEVFLAAYLPTTALRLLIVVISIGISGEPPDSHPFLEMLEAGVSVPTILMILVMAVFVAPIVEELQFRVVILGGIAQLGKPVLALIASSILFSFAHGFPDSIALIPLALALGYTYLRRRSYVTVMLVHFLFNGFNMILALAALI